MGKGIWYKRNTTAYQAKQLNGTEIEQIEKEDELMVNDGEKIITGRGQLLISRLASDNAGEYKCFVTYKDKKYDSHTFLRKTVFLEVKEEIILRVLTFGEFFYE